MQSLGLPAFEPVQWNIATNKKKGTLRGIHAEPWDKYVHMVSGRGVRCHRGPAPRIADVRCRRNLHDDDEERAVHLARVLATRTKR